MQRLLLIFVSLLLASSAYSQSLRKYPLGKSGCRAYFLCDPGEFALEKSPDSSEVYTGECTQDSVSYGAICVKLKDKISDLKVSEDVLVAYLDYLKGSLKITNAAGYGKGHRLKNRETTRGIIDYWQDSEGLHWKVKGWTDGKYIAVLYVYSKREVPETKANVFLDSLLFAGM